MNKHVCAEIQYHTENGNAHSDICFEKVTPEKRRLLHDSLDEFLDNSKFESGDLFYVGDRTPEESRSDVMHMVLMALMKIEDEKRLWGDIAKVGGLTPPPDESQIITDAVCRFFEITD